MSKINELKFGKARDSLNRKDDFLKLLNTKISAQDFESIPLLVSEFSAAEPIGIDFLYTVHWMLLSKVGNKKIVSEVAQSIFQSQETFENLRKNVFCARPVIEISGAPNFTKVVDYVVLITYLKLLGCLTNKPFLFVPQNTPYWFKGFQLYLSDIFEILYDQSEHGRGASFSAITLLNCDVIGTSKENCQHYYEFIGYIQNDLIKKNIPLKVLTLKKETTQAALKYLSHFGEIDKLKIVTMNLENGKSDDHYKAVKSDFLPVVTWLIKSGYTIIHVGKNSTIEFPELTGLINLTNLDYPIEVDLFISAQSEFVFGCDSDHTALAHAFDTPQLLVNAIPFSGMRVSTFAQCAPLFWSHPFAQLSIGEIVDNSLLSDYANELIKNKNILVKPFKADKILAVTKEMIEYLAKGPIYERNQDFSEKKKKYGLNGALCSDTLDLLSKG